MESSPVTLLTFPSDSLVSILSGPSWIRYTRQHEVFLNAGPGRRRRHAGHPHLRLAGRRPHLSVAVEAPSYTISPRRRQLPLRILTEDHRHNF